MSKFHDSLGYRIQVRRKETGQSLRDLAGKRDLTASFISQVERGQTNPSIDSLRRIAEALKFRFSPFFQILHNLNRKRAAPKINHSPMFLLCVPMLALNLPSRLPV